MATGFSRLQNLVVQKIQAVAAPFPIEVELCCFFHGLSDPLLKAWYFPRLPPPRKPVEWKVPLKWG